MELSFRRVSKASPCPQCGKPDWCTVGDYGVVCMRVQSARPVKNGGWFHRVWRGRGRPLPPPPPRRQRRPSTPPRCTASGWPARRPRRWRRSPRRWACPRRRWRRWARPGRRRTRRGRFRCATATGTWSASGCATSAASSPCAAAGRASSWPTVPAQKTLFVCEGPTDTAAAVELGLFAVGRPNCCCGGAGDPHLRAPARVRQGGHRLRQRQARPGRRAQGRRRAAGCPTPSMCRRPRTCGNLSASAAPGT